MLYNRANGATELEELRAERDALRLALTELEKQLASTENDLRRSIAESYALYLTGLDITSQLELNPVLLSILRRAVLIVGAAGGLISLVDSEDGNLTVSAEYNVSPSLLGTRILSGAGVAGTVLQTRRLVKVEDYAQWDHRMESQTASIARSTVGLPLRWHDEVLGVLTVFHTRKDANFSFDDLDSLQHVTVQAAIAIYNAKRYTAERARTRRLDVLYKSATRITSSLDLTDVTVIAAESLMLAAHVRGCAIMECLPGEGIVLQLLGNYQQTEAGLLEIRAEAALAPMRQLPDAVRHVLHSGDWLVLQRDDPYLFPDMRRFMERFGVQSAMLVPIRLEKKVIGLIKLYETEAPHRFTAEDADTIQTLAAHVGIAIRHAQLHSQLAAQRRNEQAILLNLARQYLATTDAAQIVQLASQAIPEAFKCQFFTFFMAEPNGRLMPCSALGYNLEELQRHHWDIDGFNGVGYAARTGEIVVMDDALSEDRFIVHQSALSRGVRSAMVAPMYADTRLLGMISLGSANKHAFADADKKLFSVFAYQTAVALERAVLFNSLEAQNRELEARVEARVKDTEAVLQAAGESLVVFDARGNIQRVNRAFEIQHDLAAEQLVGKPCSEVFGFDLVGKASYPHNAADDSVWRGEMQIPKADGSLYDAAVSLSRMFNAESELIGTVASLRDVSYLTELNRMKNTFISNTSHELRTPITNIKLYLKLLSEGHPSRRESYMATLERESRRLEQLIEDLLTVSRLEQNTITLNFRLISINTLVHTLVEDRRALVESRGLSLTSILDPDALLVSIDERMISQAVTNLLINAVNYTSSGGKIQVFTRHTDQHVIIEVADTGLGISKEDQARLFERFYRGSAAKTTNAPGTGLGMSIVKEIIDRHQGEIRVTSKPSTGSILALYLPLYPKMIR
jgi:PAS domain S-box-containing protein